jgi:hypothetical protein
MTDETQDLENALGQSAPLSDRLGFDREEIHKTRVCSHLLPYPGGEIVRECLDEIERLRTLLVECREMTDYTNASRNIAAAIDNYMKHKTKYES